MQVGLTAIEKGMTFFYVKNTDTISLCMSLIRRYAKKEGAVLFCEDIDQKASGEERTSDINELLNILDGVQGKGQNIKLLLTTNHETRIPKALRRPGRIDHVIYFENPKDDVPVQIIQKFCANLKVDKKVDWNAVKVEIPENSSGSLIAEIGKRVVTMYNKKGLVDQDLLYTACVSVKAQAKFMTEDVEVDNTLGTAMGIVGEALLRPAAEKLQEM